MQTVFHLLLVVVLDAIGCAIIVQQILELQIIILTHLFVPIRLADV
jgi:hypothetical protein